MRNEVALMNKFRGDQIVLEIFDQYNFRDRLWIFVELMEDAMTPIIANLKTNYSENACKYVLRQCLLGLEVLHAKHVIHRDIKSDNILADSEGNVKLADFGYSAQLTSEREARSSRVGTVCWMAPELIKRQKRYDCKVDIWSLGIFAYELTNGDPPYIQESQSQIILNIVRLETPPIESKWSPEFQEFVTACLLKEPEDRPSATELLDHPFIRGAEAYKAEFAQVVQQHI